MSQLSLLPSTDIAAAILSTAGRFSGFQVASRMGEKVQAVNDVILEMHEDGLLIEHRFYEGEPGPKKWRGYYVEWECKVKPKQEEH